MRFETLSRHEKYRLKRERRREWHMKFAWWPKRIDSETVVWLEKFGRKDSRSYGYSGDIDKKPEWQYKLSDELLIAKLKGNA